jgi:hypothetical protein
MNSGLLALLVVTGIVICTGFVLAVSVLRSAWMRREKELLVSMDLTALEESAVYLMEQLKNEADRAIAQIDQRISGLELLIKEADVRLSKLTDAIVEARKLSDYLGAQNFEPAETGLVSRLQERENVAALVSSGLSDDKIAQITGLSVGEIRLIKKLTSS